MELAELKFDEKGLVTVVAQDHRTGEVRMLAHADSAALERTIETGFACFYSRSRQKAWMKGEESGNRLRVQSVWHDCDADAVLYLVQPEGPSCHTGREGCFFEQVHPSAKEGRAAPVLLRLEGELEMRKASSGDTSYTKSLLEKGAAKIGEKIREEAGELADAVAGESDARVVSEAADVMYHVMVGLLSRGVLLADVQAELARRFGVSGHQEKASRGD